MKNVFLSLCIITFVCTSFSKSYAQEGGMDPRFKAVGVMALYGTVGGALLGTASLAFDTGGRSIAKGASLGLYAGLLFGGYIIISHSMRKSALENPAPQENYYSDEEDGEYDEEDDGYGYDDETGGDDQSYRWRPSLGIDQISWRYQSDNKRPKATKPVDPILLYFDFVNYSF